MDAREIEAHKRYIALLRAMSPEKRLKKAFEMGRLGRELFTTGLRKRFPELSEDEFQKLLRRRLDLCHNRNY